MQRRIHLWGWRRDRQFYRNYSKLSAAQVRAATSHFFSTLWRSWCCRWQRCSVCIAGDFEINNLLCMNIFNLFCVSSLVTSLLIHSGMRLAAKSHRNNISTRHVDSVEWIPHLISSISCWQKQLVDPSSSHPDARKSSVGGMKEHLDLARNKEASEKRTSSLRLSEKRQKTQWKYLAVVRQGYSQKKTITLFTPLCVHLSAISVTSPTKVKKTYFLIHSRPKVPSFVCNLCDRRFSSQALLTVHLRRHSGERPFACLFCEKGSWHMQFRSPIYAFTTTSARMTALFATRHSHSWTHALCTSGCTWKRNLTCAAHVECPLAAPVPCWCIHGLTRGSGLISVIPVMRVSPRQYTVYHTL